MNPLTTAVMLSYSSLVTFNTSVIDILSITMIFDSMRMMVYPRSDVIEPDLRMYDSSCLLLTFLGFRKNLIIPPRFW